MLCLCPKEISKPLKILYEKSCYTGIFPDVWKQANVQAVHKKDSRHGYENYRPISLLPILSKICEKIIFDQIYSFTQNHLISDM